MNRNEIYADILAAIGGMPGDDDTRNDLLEKIVTQAGGTVTGESRNELLQDYLTAIGG